MDVAATAPKIPYPPECIAKITNYGGCLRLVPRFRPVAVPHVPPAKMGVLTRIAFVRHNRPAAPVYREPGIWIA